MASLIFVTNIMMGSRVNGSYKYHEHHSSLCLVPEKMNSVGGLSIITGWTSHPDFEYFWANYRQARFFQPSIPLVDLGADLCGVVELCIGCPCDQRKQARSDFFLSKNPFEDSRKMLPLWGLANTPGDFLPPSWNGLVVTMQIIYDNLIDDIKHGDLYIVSSNDEKEHGGCIF